MNLSMKQNRGRREQACGGQGGRVWERGGEGGKEKSVRRKKRIRAPSQVGEDSQCWS